MKLREFDAGGYDDLKWFSRIQHPKDKPAQIAIFVAPPPISTFRDWWCLLVDGRGVYAVIKRVNSWSNRMRYPEPSYEKAKEEAEKILAKLPADEPNLMPADLAKRGFKEADPSDDPTTPGTRAGRKLGR